MLRKILGWGALAFLIFYVITKPESAAHLIRGFAFGAADFLTRVTS